jgi:hypothetical protein
LDRGCSFFFAGVRLPTGELEKALARKIVRTGTVLQRVAGLTALRDRAIDAIVKRIVEGICGRNGRWTGMRCELQSHDPSNWDWIQVITRSEATKIARNHFSHPELSVGRWKPERVIQQLAFRVERSDWLEMVGQSEQGARCGEKLKILDSLYVPRGLGVRLSFSRTSLDPRAKGRVSLGSESAKGSKVLKRLGSSWHGGMTCQHLHDGKGCIT